MLSGVLDRVSNFPSASTSIERGRIRPAVLGAGRPSTYGDTWDWDVVPKRRWLTAQSALYNIPKEGRSKRDANLTSSNKRPNTIGLWAVHISSCLAACIMCALDRGLPALGETGLLDISNLISARLNLKGPHWLVSSARDDDDGTWPAPKRKPIWTGAGWGCSLR
jgi:hypothetical protein